MSAVRKLSEDMADRLRPPLSGFRLGSSRLRLVPEAARPGVPPTPRLAHADEDQEYGFADSLHPVVTAKNDPAGEAVSAIGADRGYGDSRGSHAWAGRLICMLTALMTSGCILLAIL